MTDQDQPPQFSTAEFEPVLEDSHGLFARGLLFGVGAALLGLALYSTVGIITGYEIGFVSLAVGWIVGRGVLMGSRGRTGRRYQIAAALLTYFAVSMSSIPVAIAYIVKAGDTDPKAVSAPAEAGTVPTQAAAPKTESAAESEGEPVSFAAVAGTLLWVGLAAPFLQLSDMPGGLLSIVILFVGIQIAWKTTGSPTGAVRDAITASGSDDTPTSLNISR